MHTWQVPVHVKSLTRRKLCWWWWWNTLWVCMWQWISNTVCMWQWISNTLRTYICDNESVTQYVCDNESVMYQARMRWRLLSTRFTQSCDTVTLWSTIHRIRWDEISHTINLYTSQSICLIIHWWKSKIEVLSLQISYLFFRMQWASEARRIQSQLELWPS
jgi:hypothetical protein